MASNESRGRPLGAGVYAEEIGALGRDMRVQIGTGTEFGRRRARQLNRDVMRCALKLDRMLDDSPQAA